MGTSGRHLPPILDAGKPVLEITTQDIAEYRDARLAQTTMRGAVVNPGTVCRELSLLGRIFIVARVDGLYRTDHHLTMAKVQATPERDPKEVVNAHVRRLEVRRASGAQPVGHIA